MEEGKGGGRGREGEKGEEQQRQDKRCYYFPVLVHRDVVLISCNHYVIQFFMLFFHFILICKRFPFCYTILIIIPLMAA